MHSIFKLEIQRVMCDNSAISSTNIRITGLGFAEAKMLIFLFKNTRKYKQLDLTWPLWAFLNNTLFFNMHILPDR